jgi:hypothetical protein
MSSDAHGQTASLTARPRRRERLLWSDSRLPRPGRSTRYAGPALHGRLVSPPIGFDGGIERLSTDKAPPPLDDVGATRIDHSVPHHQTLAARAMNRPAAAFRQASRAHMTFLRVLPHTTQAY